MSRHYDPAVRELMDEPQPVTAELERDLDNLTTLNRVFGSHALVLDFLRPRLNAARPDLHPRLGAWRILDLATASGDIPRIIAAWAARKGIAVEIDAVDFQPSTLEIARKRSMNFPNINFHEGDIRNFGAGEKWDIVLCSLALHHFSDDDATLVLRHAASLASRHVLAADLRRCAAGTLGVDLLTAVWMREPMTRTDARMSVRRAFSFDEFAKLARDAGWKNFGHARKFCFRQALWMVC
jgi:2-polyprenyl-3-methyl-5-hydroxy-6-metoxy-1,4-benzoquinol methylase